MPIPVEYHRPDFNKAIASIIWTRQTTSSTFNCHVSNCPLCQTTRPPDRPPMEGKRWSQPQQLKASGTDHPKVVNWLIPSSTPMPSLVADRKKVSSRTSSPPRKRSAPSPPPSVVNWLIPSPTPTRSLVADRKKASSRTSSPPRKRSAPSPPLSVDHRFQCRSCPESFAKKIHLRIHRRVHTGRHVYCCQYCPMVLDCPSRLVRHRRVHTGERPYRCSFEGCEREFTCRSSLNRHYKMHFPVAGLRG